MDEKPTEHSFGTNSGNPFAIEGYENGKIGLKIPDDLLVISREARSHPEAKSILSGYVEGLAGYIRSERLDFEGGLTSSKMDLSDILSMRTVDALNGGMDFRNPDNFKRGDVLLYHTEFAYDIGFIVAHHRILGAERRALLRSDVPKGEFFEYFEKGFTGHRIRKGSLNIEHDLELQNGKRKAYDLGLDLYVSLPDFINSASERLEVLPEQFKNSPINVRKAFHRYLHSDNI